ncbi:transporter substrate-binding domain-containing protein [Mucilaginibacter sp.]|uniref:transporter substrate-binding domain-containing protein n=1 Tax=Mucilaginibacter sp. TaxID=1882438 RepID=UPI002844F1EA|nr:transporter substrate-binding domain-containing protein [Mucilaginibacter sp.]MDR3694143.1 transporter substrate-binding domain-containing protein [Mucilaginibacter sp.]
MKFYRHCSLLFTVLVLLFVPKIYGQQHQLHDTTSRLAHIQKYGILRIGVPGDYAPFAITRGDSLSGADIRLGRALASAMGAKPVFVKTSWANLAADMRNDAFDIALGGISITPERAAVASFSVSYHSGGKTFLCRRADSARFSTIEAVNKPGVRLIENKGGTNESVARSLFPAATLQIYPDNIGIFNEIVAGHADVMVTDDTEADLKARQYPQLCRSFAGTITKSDKALWIHTDATLVRFVNNWLQKELAEGMPQQWLKEAMAPGH